MFPVAHANADADIMRQSRVLWLRLLWMTLALLLLVLLAAAIGAATGREDYLLSANKRSPQRCVTELHEGLWGEARPPSCSRQRHAEKRARRRQRGFLGRTMVTHTTDPCCF